MIISENIKSNKKKIWGSFKLSTGETVKFEMKKGESWFQWGASQDKLWETISRTEQLCEKWNMGEMVRRSICSSR